MLDPQILSGDIRGVPIVAMMKQILSCWFPRLRENRMGKLGQIYFQATTDAIPSRASGRILLWASSITPICIYAPFNLQ